MLLIPVLLKLRPLLSMQLVAFFLIKKLNISMVCECDTPGLKTGATLSHNYRMKGLENIYHPRRVKRTLETRIKDIAIFPTPSLLKYKG